MIEKIIYILLFYIGQNSYAQFGPQQLVDDNATNVFMVRTGDIDGDNDLDIVAPLFDDVVWYENLDGKGNFGPQHSIVTGLAESISVDLADLDGDLDLDILITVYFDNTVHWHENLDGSGNFGGPILISNGIMGADHAITADLDGDSDLDVIVNSDIDNILSWFENIDGAGTFGTKQIVTSSSTNGRSVFAGDIDGDLDIDLVTSSSGSITIAWFENLDGLGNFSGENVIAGSALAIEDLYGVDIDGDDDLDILSATPSQDRVAWHENLDGLGTFGPQIIIYDDAGFPRSVYAADLDNDMDMDVLSGGSDFDENISWYENLDGAGTFGPPEEIEGVEAGGIRSVYAADLDGDGDEDVLGALLREWKVTWYENLTILDIQDNDLATPISIYPNPVRDILSIESELEVKSFKLYDILGRLVLEENAVTTEINLSTIASGVFLVHLETEEGTLVKKLVKE